MTEKEFEEKLEKASQQNYELGILSGMDIAAQYLFDEAVDAFKSNKDERAKELKKLAAHIRVTKDGKRAQYDKKWGIKTK